MQRAIHVRIAPGDSRKKKGLEVRVSKPSFDTRKDADLPIGGDLVEAFWRVAQARRAARRLLEIDEAIADDEPLPLGRDHLIELYRECWALLEAAPSILRDEFEAIVGVKLARFAFALHAIGWELLSPAARASRVVLQEKAPPFISPGEFGHE
jgi:hypothetical protein